MSEEVVYEPGPKRRFRRTRPADIDAGVSEALASLHGEVLLLREENSRLKAAQHHRADISRLLGRARSLPSADVDRDNLEDDSAQLLVDGLVIRESLLEICQEIERSMVAFEARLNALGAAAVDRSSTPVSGNGSNSDGPA
jgi:hypothetical protein